MSTDAPELRNDMGALQERVRYTLTRLSLTGELPTLPGVVAQALTIAREPNADVDELCRVVQADVGTAARVLRVANSALYARRTACRTLREAVTTIGMRTICDILVGASVRTLYDVKNATARALWDHALAVAVAAEELAPLVGGVRRGTAFLPGLFHDIGQIAFLLASPGAFDVIEDLVAKGCERIVLEREWYDFDHADAGAMLAIEWGITPEAVDAIRWHHAPEQAGPGKALALVLHLADRLTYSIGLGAGGTLPRYAGPAGAHLSSEQEAVFGERLQEAFAAQRALFQ
jgi:HD-like signal output (HDOD) protein